MKKDIHPKYQKTKVKCACGAEFELGSTKENLKVEVCSACHPFYTGKEKLVDSAGRVDRFKKILEKKEKVAQKRQGKKIKKQKRASQKAKKQKA